MMRTDYYFYNAKGEYIPKMAHNDKEADEIIEKAKKRGWNWTYRKEEYDLEEAIKKELDFELTLATKDLSRKEEW